MSDRLVTVATFHDPVAAALAKNFLESEGISAVLFDESTVATDWMLSMAIGGIKLQVEPTRLERAEFLLARIQQNKENDPDKNLETPVAAHTAIATQEIAEELQSERVDKEPINQLVDRLFRCAVFGLLLWPLQAYVLILLAQLALEKGKVSPKRRWKIWTSMLLNIPLMSLIVVPLLYFTDSFGSGAGEPQNPIWRRHDYKAQAFSVKFPHEPKLSSGTVDSRFGAARSSTWSAQAYRRTYRVQVLRCPAMVREFTPEKLLKDEMINKVDQDDNLLKDDPIHLKDVPGREYLLNRGKYLERGQLFFRGQDFYLLMAHGSKEEVYSNEAEQFFKSFRLH